MNDYHPVKPNISRGTHDNRRFHFGRNWRKYLKNLSDERIQIAEESLKSMLQQNSLEGLTFLDVGCGSGLFSLAALRLGAKEVVSFDYDIDSVRCAEYLNDTYGPYPQWKILRASILDYNQITMLGKFDLVYSWGVLHHTGDMWKAIDNVIKMVNDNGRLFISIYNNQGLTTVIWKRIKRVYNVAPRWLQFIFGNFFFIGSAMLLFILDVVQSRSITARYKGTDRRGMDAYHDAIDWIGGYPFETAKPEEIFHYCRDRNLLLVNLLTRQGSGCNEFVFFHPPEAGNMYPSS